MDRRTALGLIGSAQLAGLAAAQQEAVPPDQPQDLKPAGANLGTLFPYIDRLAARNQYPYSFLTSRFARSRNIARPGGKLYWMLSDISLPLSP